MKNKPRTLEQYIDYRNTLIKRREARHKHGLIPVNGKEDYYSIRLREVDRQITQFKGLGQVRLK